MASEDEEGLTPVALRIREVELEVDADMPLIRNLAEESVVPLPPMPRQRDPHQDWPLREFGRRGTPGEARREEHQGGSEERGWEDIRAAAPLDERSVAAYRRLMEAEQRLYELGSSGETHSIGVARGHAGRSRQIRRCG
jgi:hypothetical protein